MGLARRLRGKETRLVRKNLAAMRRVFVALSVVAFVFFLRPDVSLADTQTRTVSLQQPSYSAATPTTALVAAEVIEPNDSNNILSSAFTYDAHGNRTSTTVSGGNVAQRTSHTTYDTTGRFPATTSSAVFGSNPFSSSVSPNAAQTVSYLYDPALGLVTSESHAVTTGTSPSTVTTKYVYDAWGRKTSEISPISTGTAWQYLLCQAQTGATDPVLNSSVLPACPSYATYAIVATPEHFSGTTASYQNGPQAVTYYDALDHVVLTVTQAYNGSTYPWSYASTTYDNLGRAQSKYQPSFTGPTSGTLAATYAYDVFNRVTLVTAADGSTTSTAYTNPNVAGQCFTQGTMTGCYAQTKATDQLGHVTTTTKNSRGKVIKQVDPAGGTTTYGYDAFANLNKAVDPAGHTTTAHYTIRGWRDVLVDPDRGTWMLLYDALGEPIVQTDGRGLDTYLWYDSIGRLVERYAPNATGSGTTGIYDQWTYDIGSYALGKQVAASRYYDDSGTGTDYQWQYNRYTSYDQYQRPVLINEQTDYALNWLGGHSFNYDIEGRVAYETRPSGLTLQYNYTGYGSLSSIGDYNTGATYWQVNVIDAAGRVTQDTTAGVFMTGRSYDPSRGWLNQIQAAYTGTSTSLWSETTGTLAAGGHDAKGNVLKRTSVMNGAAVTSVCGGAATATVTDTAGYDVLDRVTSFATSSTCGTSLSKLFGYSADGNLTSKSDLGSYTYAGTQPHAMTAAGGNSYGYDANGNATSRNGAAITYNNANLPLAAFPGSSAGAFTTAQVWYGYGTENQHTVQNIPGGSTPTTTRYYGAGTWRINTPTAVYLRDYIKAPTGVVADILIPAGSTSIRTVSALFSDHLGSVAAVASLSSGAVAEPRGYDAWGKMRPASGADDSTNAVAQASSEPTAYVGDEYVKPLALLNLNARLYDPTTGRFLAPDPMNGRGGQGLNPYSYVQNNPLTDSDPSGLCGFFSCPARQIFGKGTFFAKNSQIFTPIIAIVAVVTFQYYVFPALAGELGATTVVAGDSVISSTVVPVSTFADLSPGLTALDIGLSGAIGGAINTGTLRGTLIGAATAEAFWGVGGLKGDIARAVGDVSGAGAINVTVGVALHAAVGCVSSAAGGGQCGSGALSAGFGELFTDATHNLTNNPIVGSAIAGLGGGTGAAISGGKFGDGFAIAAAGFLYNEEADEEEENGRGWLEDLIDPFADVRIQQYWSAYNQLQALDPINPLAQPQLTSPGWVPSQQDVDAINGALDTLRVNTAVRGANEPNFSVNVGSAQVQANLIGFGYSVTGTTNSGGPVLSNGLNSFSFYTRTSTGSYGMMANILGKITKYNLSGP